MSSCIIPGQKVNYDVRRGLIPPPGGESVGPPDHLTFDTQPDDAAAGAPFAQQPIVKIRDAEDQVVTEFTDDVTIRSAPAINEIDFNGMTGADFVTAGAGKSFSIGLLGVGVLGVWFNTGTEAQPDTVGVDLYVEVVIDPLTPESNLIEAAALALSGMFITDQSLPDRLVIEQMQSESSVAAAEDIDTGASFEETRHSSPLLGTTTVAAINGVATFTNLSIGVMLDGIELEASIEDPALSVLSAEFDVGGATLLASLDISDEANIDTFSRPTAAGFSGNGELTFQHEAAVDVLRSAHYVGSLPCVLLEDSPLTACILVAPDNLEVTPGELEFDAEWDDIPVTGSLLRYEYRLDGAGSWTSNATSTTLSAVAATAGSHTLNVRAVSDGGVHGETATSASFEVEDVEPPAEELLFDSFDATGEGTWNFANGADGQTGDQAGQELFSDGSAHTVTKIKAYVTAVGNVSGRTLYCAIYTDSGGNHDLGSLVGTSDGVTGSNAWAKTSVDFTFSTPVALSASTNYHLVWYSVQDANLATFSLHYNVATLIAGQLCLWNGAGVNQYPATFPGHDIQLQIWGTTP